MRRRKSVMSKNNGIKKNVELRTPNDGLRMYSALTHGIGALLAGVATGVLITLSAFAGARVVVSYSIFGVTLIGLYTASTLYHCVPAKPNRRRALRVVDHIMVYMLIAGTYTPVCLIALRDKPTWGWTIFGVVWGMVVIGSLIKIFWLSAPRWISAAAYIGMGWMILIAIYPMIQTMSNQSLLWLVLGGVLYTVGGILYALKWPGKERKYFGFHEVFHLFIMLGSVCHYAMMICIMPNAPK